MMIKEAWEYWEFKRNKEYVECRYIKDGKALIELSLKEQDLACLAKALWFQYGEIDWT